MNTYHFVLGIALILCVYLYLLRIMNAYSIMLSLIIIILIFFFLLYNFDTYVGIYFTRLNIFIFLYVYMQFIMKNKKKTIRLLVCLMISTFPQLYMFICYLLYTIQACIVPMILPIQLRLRYFTYFSFDLPRI